MEKRRISYIAASGTTSYMLIVWDVSLLVPQKYTAGKMIIELLSLSIRYLPMTILIFQHFGPVPMYILIVDGYPRRAIMRFDRIPMAKGIVNNSTDAANHIP